MTVRILFLMALCFTGVGHATDTATVTRNTSLYAEPFTDAKTLLSLVKGDEVQIDRRKGGWYSATANNQNGWIRATHIRTLSAKHIQTQKQNKAGLLQSLESGLTEKEQGATGAAIKGLDEESLSSANPDAKSVDTMEGYRISAEDAAAFAEKENLESENVEFDEIGTEKKGGFFNMFEKD